MLDIILYLCVRQRTMGSVKLSVLYLEVAKETENLSVFSLLKGMQIRWMPL
jgi:hypothetical protein